MDHFLLIANRQTTIESLQESLTDYACAWLVARNQRAALRSARYDAPRVIILDHSTPRHHHVGLSHQLRELIDAPLIAIVREREEMARFAATDFLVKPYSFQELTERVERALAYPCHLQVGPLRLHLRQRTVEAPHHPDPQPLSPKLFALLRFLMLHAGRVVTRQELMRAVWQTDFMGDTRTLDVHIRWLRERIEPEPRAPAHLQTVRGTGYRLLDDSPP